MDDREYKEAQKRAKEKIKFYKHLRSYIVVNVMMTLLVLLTGGGFNWGPVWIGWGIGLAFHYMNVFGFPGAQGKLSKSWEREMIEKEMRGVEEEDEKLELEKLEKLKKKERLWDDKDIV